MISAILTMIFFAANPDLASLADGVWTCDDSAVMENTQDGQGFTLRVVREQENHTACGQRISVPDSEDEKCCRFRAHVETESANFAYLSVKFYRNKREIRRVVSPIAQTGGDDVELCFSPGNADTIELLCRTSAQGRLGESVRFSDFTLEEIPPGLADWNMMNGRANFISRTNDEITAMIHSPGKDLYRIGGAARTRFPSGGELEFALDVDVPYVEFAGLEAEFFKNGKKIGSASSRWNSCSQQTLRLKFLAPDADEIRLSCVFPNEERFNGERVRLSGFYFGRARDLPEVETPPVKCEVVPGFQSAGLYVKNLSAATATRFSGQVFVRENSNSATEWQPAGDLAYTPREREARACIRNLSENSPYQVKVHYVQNGVKSEVVQEFRTRSTELPIAETIVLRDGEKFNLKSGTETGYIRYTAEPGAVIPGGVSMDGLSYVILSGLTLRGGDVFGLHINNCRHVVVENCDIADFGRVGEQRVDLDGKFFLTDGGEPRVLNNDAGIRLTASDDVRVERCYIHDPRGTANSWFYSHPAGPNAMFIGDTTRATIRWNDFIGSDAKRWNDAVESLGNGWNCGGPWRDAEIAGNYFAFGNDDGMELDGAQVNCRFFGNLTEGLLCGVSTAPCRRGPTYVYQNAFYRPGDEYDLIGVGVKNNYGKLGWGRIYVLENIILGHSGAISGPGGSSEEYEGAERAELLKIVTRGNLADSGWFLSRDFFRNMRGDCDYDTFTSPKFDSERDFLAGFGQETHAKKLESAPEVRNYPVRPTPFFVSAQHLEIPMDSEDSKFAEVEISSEVAIDVEVLQPEGAPFFRVTPRRFRLEPGQTRVLRVENVPERVTQARRNTSAFVIRTENGLSRPVSVLVDSSRNSKLLASDRKDVIYGEVEVQENGESELRFDVPADGEYWLFAKSGPSEGRWRSMSVDGVQPVQRRGLRPRHGNSTDASDPWICVSSDVFSGGMDHANRPIPLTRGPHTVRLQGTPVTRAALTREADALRLAP